jgi:hypothetical protein
MGPFVMSLNEMEQLEAISGKKRLCSTLQEWAGSTHGSQPFSFFAEARARKLRATLNNEFVRESSV